MRHPVRVIFACLCLCSMALACGRAATPTPTPVPTATPQPTATLQPTPTHVPGWQRLEGGGLELWLPESYMGGDLSKDMTVIVQKLRSLGADFEPFAQAIEENPSLYVIWAFDTRVGKSGFVTNVNVTTQQVLPSMTIETILEAGFKQLPAGFQLLQQQPVALDGYDAQRVTLEFTVSGMAGKEVMYAIKEGDTIWVITFATGADELDQRLAVFEQSARTFAVQP